MIIRPAAAADLAPMWEMFGAVASAGDTLPFDSTFDREAFRRQWLESEMASHVALDGGTLTAMYQWGANRGGRGAHVATATYLVGAGHQGRGIGRALVRHSLSAARQAGYLAMQFNYVVGTNAAAIHLYRSLGFEVVGTLPLAFRHATLGLVDAHVMYRLL